MPTGSPYPDLDALLRGAKASLARADALQASIDADAQAMGRDQPVPDSGPAFAADLMAGITHHPLDTLAGFFQGAAKPAARVAIRLGENALGLGRVAIDPMGVARDTANTISTRIALGQRPTLSEGVKTLTGVDPSSDYPEMAADALTALLFARGIGAKGPEVGFERPPTGAVEPRIGPSEFAVTDAGKVNVGGRVPQREGPIPVAARPKGAPAPELYAPNVSGYVPPAPAPIAEPVPPAPAPEPSVHPDLARWLARYGDAAPPDVAAVELPPVPTVRERLAQVPEPPVADIPDGDRYVLRAPKSLSDLFPDRAPTYEPPAGAPAPPTVEPAPRPKLAADEVAQMLRGRQRFSEQFPDAALKPGAQDELDRLGVEYNRTQRELKRLLGLSDADPAEVRRMQQGARELGARLRTGAKGAAHPPASKVFADVSSGRAAQFHDVPDGVYNTLRDKFGGTAEPSGPGPSTGTNIAGDDVAPTVAPDDLHRFLNERGAADLGLLAKWLGLPVGGAVAGSLLDDQHPGEGAIAGATVGGAAALAPTLLRGLMKPGAFQAHQTGSLLFSPATIAKIATSNTSGALLKAAERAMEQRSLAPVGRVARELADVPQLWSDAKEAFQHPDTHSGRFDQPQGRGLFGVATRAVGAADAPFRKAMERAGMSTEDALTVTQQREPITETGKAFVRLQRSTPVTRGLIPFMKSMVNAGETGLVEPAQSARKLMAGRGTGGDLAKVGMATGAAGAGMVGDEALKDAPPWLQGLIMAMAGPYATSMALGRGLAKGDPFTALQNALPLGQGIGLSPKAWIARFVPRIFWDHKDTHTQRSR
ncbi:MAG TPA: hypothetical protein VF188_00095 [Longimicrobiales bacterium]